MTIRRIHKHQFIHTAILCNSNTPPPLYLYIQLHTHINWLYNFITSILWVLFGASEKLCWHLDPSCMEKKIKLGVVQLRSCHKNLSREGLFSHASSDHCHHSLNPVNSIYISYFLSLNCLFTLLIYSAKLLCWCSVLSICFHYINLLLEIIALLLRI